MTTLKAEECYIYEEKSLYKIGLQMYTVISYISCSENDIAKC